jgi:glycine cleavage system regulatory protein
MRTQSRTEPGAGTPIYTMIIHMDAPEGTDEAVLRRELERIASTLNIEITLQPVA